MPGMYSLLLSTGLRKSTCHPGWSSGSGFAWCLLSWLSFCFTFCGIK